MARRVSAPAGTAERLIVPLLAAARDLPAAAVADALAAALAATTRVTVATAAELPRTGVVVADGLPAGMLPLAATAWPHTVPVLLVPFTPAGARAAGGLLEAVGPGVARRTVLAVVPPSATRPPALAYALLHVAAALAPAVVLLPPLTSPRGRRRIAGAAAALAAAVRAVPAPSWPAPSPPGPRFALQEAS